MGCHVNAVHSLMKVNEIKASYRTEFQELQLVRQELDQIDGLVSRCRSKLLLEFSQWFAEVGGDAGGEVGCYGEPVWPLSPIHVV
jgi:kinesin family protein 6/9